MSKEGYLAAERKNSPLVFALADLISMLQDQYIEKWVKSVNYQFTTAEFNAIKIRARNKNCVL